nr:PREDICTED: acidic repeat-containing protein isoform X2 [Latimeria chalumnae]|eukprot:XP_006003825.1 PREDICTED: acidic repeat-containing protein isoform X2 [Latimeria chalumnae]
MAERLAQSVKKTKSPLVSVSQASLLSPDSDNGESPITGGCCALKLLLSNSEGESEDLEKENQENLQSDGPKGNETRRMEPKYGVSSWSLALMSSAEDELSDSERNPQPKFPSRKDQKIKSRSLEISSSSSSDEEFEMFLSQMKTPKPMKTQKNCSDSLKDFIVDEVLDNEDFVMEVRKCRKPIPAQKEVKGTWMLDMKCLDSVSASRRGFSPLQPWSSAVCVSDSENEDSVIRKSTWQDHRFGTRSGKQEAQVRKSRKGDSDVSRTVETYNSNSRSGFNFPAAHSTGKGMAEMKTGGGVKSGSSLLTSSGSSEEEVFSSLLDRIQNKTKLQTPSSTANGKIQARTVTTEPVNRLKGSRVNVVSTSTRPNLGHLSKPADVPSSFLHGDTPPDQTTLEYKTISQSEPRTTVGKEASRCQTPDCFLHDLFNPASPYLKNFKQKKEELVQRLYTLYNCSVFDCKLPEKMEISWNRKMRKTAGYCVTGQKRGKDGQRYARIELSEKVCDSADRLRDTLIHEMCHAATWIINGVRDGHGQFWRLYARKCKLAHPELPMVTRCHSYEINYKYRYQCTSCKNMIGRHSKSLDTKHVVCALCKGYLVLLQSTHKNGMPTRTHLTPFAKYVKENYGSRKKEAVGLSHAEVMRKLSADFAMKTKILDS